MSLITTYFGPISWYKELILCASELHLSESEDVLMDNHKDVPLNNREGVLLSDSHKDVLSDNSEAILSLINATERFQKQTIRTRCRIATASGEQTLSVPVQASHGDMVKDVRISDHGNWRHLHWQALSTAYGNSPFFEFYQDDIRPFFDNKWEYLLDYNNEITLKILQLLDAGKLLKSGVGQRTTHNHQQHSLRSENHRQEQSRRSEYYQVFQQRNGFIPDLSILDLLFNMGPESVLYLV